MNAKTVVRWLVMGVTFALLPVAAFGHAIIPWGAYPAAGDVVIATKATQLLDKTFVGKILTVAAIPSVYNAELATGMPSVYGGVRYVNRKGTKAKLTVDATALDVWGPLVADLLRQYRESKGDVVTDVVVTTKSAGGTATFKTKPSPIGPYHSASVSVTIKFRAVVTLEGGKTKSGIVTMAVTSKGVRLGIPGED
jgi:hypothetical protein